MKLVGIVIFQIFLVVALKSGNRNVFTTSLGNNFTNFKRHIIKKNLSFLKEGEKDVCTINLMKKILTTHGAGVLLYFNENNDFDSLRNLHENFAYFYFTNPEIKLKLVRRSFYHLLIFNSKFTSEKVLQTIQPPADRKFVVVVKKKSEVSENFEVFWKHRVTNVIIALAYGNTYKYYTYFPYKPNHCGKVGESIEVGDCDTTRGVINVSRKFYANKFENLHNCPLNVTLMENIPASYYTSGKVLDGWEVNLVVEIIRRMKGVPNFKIISPLSEIYTRSQGYASMVRNADIAGGLLIPLISLSETDFSIYDGYICSTWAVPKILDSTNSLSLLYEVFSVEVWLLIPIMTLVFAIVEKLYNKKSIFEILFKMLPFLFGNSTSVKKNRVLAILWSWFCIILTTLYQSKYQSNLILPLSPKQMDTSEEVLNSNLKLMGSSFYLTDVLPYFGDGKYNKPGRFIKLGGNTSFADLALRIGVKRDSALLGFREIMSYHIYSTAISDKVHIQSNCLMTYSLGFILKKNSHLTETFVKMTKILGENGCTTYWIKQHLTEKSRAKVPERLANAYKIFDDKENHTDQNFPKSFTLDKMIPVFVGYVAGISIAFTTFVFELLSVWYKKKTVYFNK